MQKLPLIHEFNHLKRQVEVRRKVTLVKFLTLKCQKLDGEIRHLRNTGPQKLKRISEEWNVASEAATRYESTDSKNPLILMGMNSDGQIIFAVYGVGCVIAVEELQRKT